MRQWYTYCLLLVCFLFAAAARKAPTVYYVKPAASGNGSGTDWNNASGNLQTIIDAATAGDEIWVAAGTYKPASLPGGSGNAGPRDVAFVLKSDIKIYGGFNGTETNLAQRNIATNSTVLSGDIGTAGETADNAYHVIVSVNNTAGTLLDGFTISDGNADGEGFYSIDNKSIYRFSGGGIIARGSAATFSNITVTDNKCMTNATGNGNGGGIFSQNSNLVIKDAVISKNNAGAPAAAGGTGGGLYMIGNADSVNNTSLRNVTFIQNTSANSGGGIFVHTFSKPVMDELRIEENQAGGSAGGMIILGAAASPNVATLGKISFKSNKTLNGSGAGLFISNFVNGTFTDLSFTENSASALGGGLYCIGGTDVFNNLSFTNTSFTKNTSTSSGAGAYINAFNNCTFNKVSFTENSAAASGGALYILGNANNYNTVSITEGLFSKNKSTSSGGAAYLSSYNKYHLDRVRFMENEAGAAGGALFIFSAAITSPNEEAKITNSLFYANKSTHATLGGGAIFISNYSRPRLINTTFYANTAPGEGGAININNSNTIIAFIYNSIFYNNTTGGATTDILKGTNAALFLKNSITQQAGVNGVDGILVGADPAFASTDAAATNFLQLTAGSPAVDKGDKTLLPAGILNDLSGGPRINNDQVDIGAFEYSTGQTPTTSQTISFASDIDLAYGDADHDPGATASSGLSVVYSSSDPSVATIVNNKIHIIGAGAATITAEQPGNQTYLPAAAVTKQLTVTKAALTIKPTDLSVEQFLPFPAFTAVYTGFVYNETAAALTTLPTITTNANASSAPGNYPLTATGAASPNYTISYQPGTLTITPGSNPGSNIHYVKPGGTGNGSSWANAAGNLQTMIDVAVAGDQIWVAAGTYKPAAMPGASGNNNPRDVAFVLKDNVKIFGGFNGTETIISDRNTVTNPTILSGDIGNSGDASDNAFHVVVSINNTAGTLLDGVTISGGNANADGSTSINGQTILRNSGAGIYARGSKASFSNLSIKDNNSSTTNTPGNGGAIYSFTSQLIIQDASISNNNVISANTTGGFGGAIYSEGHADTASTVTIIRSQLTQNSSRNLGGAIYMAPYSTVVMKDGTIADNTATNSSGGGIFSRSHAGAINNLELENVTVKKNQTLTGSGGGMMISYFTHTKLTNVQFIENKCISSGAGYYLQGNTDDVLLQDVIMNNVEFSRNVAAGNGSGTGGAIYLAGNFNAVLTNVHAIDNSGLVATGGMQVNGRSSFPSNFIMNGGSLINNRTPVTTGGIVLGSGINYHLDRVDFSGNTAGSQAGALWLSSVGSASGTPLTGIVSNCRFSANESTSLQLGGGAIYITATYNHPRIVNCTFYNNKALKDGAAVYVAGTTNTNPGIANCIFFGNTVVSGTGADIFKGANSNVQLKYSLTQEYGTAGLDGVIKGLNPGFASTDANAFNFLQLTAGSPAVDKGDNLSIPQDVLKDFAGNARIGNGYVDMGAFEFASGQSNPTTPQTITIGNSITKTYGDIDFDPGATASSGLTVYYSSSNSQVASIVNGKLHITGAGTVTITAMQPGNDTYLPAPNMTTTLTVVKAPLMIKANDRSVLQQEAIPALTVTYTGFVNGDTESSLGTKPTISTTATIDSPTGNYPITVSGAASNNYEISYQDGTLTIQPIVVESATLEVWFANSNTLNVQVKMPSEKAATLSLYTSIGQRLYQSDIVLKAGLNRFTIPADRLVPGVYIINVKGAGLKLDKIFIKR